MIKKHQKLLFFFLIFYCQFLYCQLYTRANDDIVQILLPDVYHYSYHALETIQQGTYFKSTNPRAIVDHSCLFRAMQGANMIVKSIKKLSSDTREAIVKQLENDLLNGEEKIRQPFNSLSFDSITYPQIYALLLSDSDGNLPKIVFFNVAADTNILPVAGAVQDSCISPENFKQMRQLIQQSIEDYEIADKQLIDRAMMCYGSDYIHFLKHIREANKKEKYHFGVVANMSGGYGKFEWQAHSICIVVNKVSDKKIEYIIMDGCNMFTRHEGHQPFLRKTLQQISEFIEHPTLLEDSIVRYLLATKKVDRADKRIKELKLQNNNVYKLYRQSSFLRKIFLSIRSSITPLRSLSYIFLGFALAHCYSYWFTNA